MRLCGDRNACACSHLYYVVCWIADQKGVVFDWVDGYMVLNTTFNNIQLKAGFEEEIRVSKEHHHKPDAKA